MKAIVIEDSRLARQGLIRMLKGFPEIEVMAEAENPARALVLIEQLQPELLFLDIHMPGGSGFDLLNQLAYSPKVIFTTAFSEYAIKSFEHHTIDYLLKPISFKRLETALEKLQDNGDELKQGLTLEPQAKPAMKMSDKIFLKDNEQCYLVSLAEIHYFESCKNYARIFFEQKNAFIKKSLSAIEARLPGQYFFRINRQYIVNLNAVKAIEEAISEGYLITMSDGKVLDISRRNASLLKERLSF
ncbi:LytR/AlgR family response regulator transcription factor [Thalassomonas actiniarum]|uniref:Response regulator transcription factor n=1 Tax=Thalassomonas actiniarum TaxID=485447 RepID=A0AAF0C453_9GAMM|nr:LytTR family DNA-binding domain-containing protein [Thalassomonas actiniarum]WDD99640.1 response regulator transcription factor [Thalassomonas actiniarum]